MAHAPEKRAIVRAAYVYDQLAIEDAAAKADISERTASRWKADCRAEGDDWDKARAVQHLAGESFDDVIKGILRDYLTFHSAIVRDMTNDAQSSPLAKAEGLSKLADAFTKIMAGIGKSSPKQLRLAVANDVLRLLGDFIRERYPREAPQFVEILPVFAEAIAQHYG